MYSPYLPAPLDETLYYLATLRRALQAIERHTSGEDVSGILFAGHLADAMHNVPVILWNWREESPWHHSETEDWISDGFPNFLSTHDAPRRWVDEAAQFTCFEYSGAELGLGKPEDITLAPVERYVYYLDFLVSFFVAARQLRNWQKIAGDVFTLQDDSSDDEKSLPTAAAEVNVYASPLVDIPVFLAQWAKFDEARFEEHARASLASFSGTFDRWERWHETSRHLAKQRQQNDTASTDQDS